MIFTANILGYALSSCITIYSETYYLYKNLPHCRTAVHFFDNDHPITYYNYSNIMKDSEKIKKDVFFLDLVTALWQHREISSYPFRLSAGADMPNLSSHIVAARLSAMGDVALLTGPLLHWHEAGGLTFTILTREAFAPLFTGHPAVTRVIGLKQEQLKGRAQRALFRALAEEFRGIPLADLHGVPRTRLLSLFWKGPVFRYPKKALARRLFLISDGHLGRDALLARNVPQRYAAALESLVPQSGSWNPRELCPRFFPTPEEEQWSHEAIAPLNLPSARRFPLVALHPFATHPSKTWPARHWKEFSRLLEERGIPHFWTGRGDANLGDPVRGRAAPLSLNFINQTSLRQLIALLARASVLVTGDSGPMHLADGVKTPVLALFGPTCREWGFFPSGEQDRVIQLPLPCRPCSLHGGGRRNALVCARAHACMESITPHMVLRELESMEDSVPGMTRKP